MADVSKILVEIGADTKDLKNQLAQSKKQVNGFASSVKKIGGIMAGAFAVRQVVKFGQESLKAYNIQAQAEQQLLVALKGRKGATDELIKQAQDLQKETLFGDEETIRAQALIAAFVKEKDQIKEVIPLVQDLAAAKGMSLAGAADLVSKTLGSSVNALSRYGIEVNGAVGSSERLNSLTKSLTNAFGGQAKAAAEAGTGGLTQLSNIWGDMKEAIGGVVYEGIKPFISNLSESINWVNRAVSGSMSHTKAVKDEQEKVNELARALGSSYSSQEERIRAYNELKKIAPSVVEGIDAENVAVGDLTKNLENYNNQVVKKLALASVKDEEAEAINKKGKLLGKLIERQKTVQKFSQFSNQSAKIQSSILAGNFTAALKQVNAEKKAAKAAREAMLDNKNATVTQVEATRKRLAQAGLLEGKIKDLIELEKEYKVSEENAKKVEAQVVATENLYNNLLGIKKTQEDINETTKAQEDINLEVKIKKPEGIDMSALMPSTDEMSEIFDETSAKMDDFNLKNEEIAFNLVDKYAQTTEALKESAAAADELGGAFSSSFSQAAEGQKDVQTAVLQTARSVLKAFLAEAVAGSIKNALVSVPPPWNLALASTAGAAAGALFNNLIPAFGDGGVVTSPTLALVGEKGPEVITPIRDLAKQKRGVGMGRVEFKIDGRQLKGVLDVENGRINSIG